MTQRTYWHLETLQRKPSEYQIVSSKLLYYPDRGFEVAVPLSDWYKKYQAESPLQCSDWEAFSDPRQTTYSLYTTLQSEKEIFVDGLLQQIDQTGYDDKLGATWVENFDRFIAPLRYPIHGLQMAAAYVGQIAPGGKIAIACAFQAADETRRLQRIAYRMRQLQARFPSTGTTSLERWQSDPVWQPWRKTIERLLITYDWGEAFVALNLAIKPAFDALFMDRFSTWAEAAGDSMWAKILRSLAEDCQWHRAWSGALVDVIVRFEPNLMSLIEKWRGKWTNEAQAAIAPFESFLTSSTMAQSSHRTL